MRNAYLAYDKAKDVTRQDLINERKDVWLDAGRVQAPFEAGTIEEFAKRYDPKTDSYVGHDKYGNRKRFPKKDYLLGPHGEMLNKKYFFKGKDGHIYSTSDYGVIHTTTHGQNALDENKDVYAYAPEKAKEEARKQAAINHVYNNALYASGRTSSPALSGQTYYSGYEAGKGVAGNPEDWEDMLRTIFPDVDEKYISYLKAHPEILPGSYKDIKDGYGTYVGEFKPWTNEDFEKNLGHLVNTQSDSSQDSNTLARRGRLPKAPTRDKYGNKIARADNLGTRDYDVYF